MKKFLLFVSLILIFISGCLKDEPSGAYCIELIGNDTCYHLEDVTCEQMCTETDWGQEIGKQFTGGHCSSRQCGYLKNDMPRSGGHTRDCISQNNTCCCDVEYTNLKICPDKWIKDQRYVIMLNARVPPEEGKTPETARLEKESFIINGEEIPGLYVDTDWVKGNCNIEPTIIECDIVCNASESCLGSCADPNITKLVTDYGVFEINDNAT